MRRFALVAYDLSLRGAAAAALPFRLGGRIETCRFGGDLSLGSSEAQRLERLSLLETEALKFWRRAGRPRVVAIEQYAFSSSGAHAHAIGEAGGVVKLALHREGVRVVPVWASAARKTLTGFGGGSSAVAKTAVRKALIAFGVRDDLSFDEYDAICTGNWLLAEEGWEFLASPPVVKRKRT